MGDSDPDDMLSWENLIYITDLIEMDGNKNISLLGGEPMLHPDFSDMLLYLLKRDFHVTVFTSGITSERTIKELKKINILHPGTTIGFVCNINNPEDTTDLYQEKRLHRFLNNFGPKTGISFNIFRVDFDISFLVDYINRYGMQKNIRLGLAHPIPGEKNLYIPLDKIKSVINRLYTFTPLLERFGVSVGPDCGFPMCAFDDAFIGWIYKMNGGNVHFGCGPAIDIGPDMQVWSCFPLHNFHRKSVFEFQSLRDIHAFFQQQMDAIHTEIPGIYEECETCHYRFRGACAGGCVAHSLNAFKAEAKIRIPEVYA
jgi:cyclic pyranopterin phosphate synthase